MLRLAVPGHESIAFHPPAKNFGRAAAEGREVENPPMMDRPLGSAVSPAG
jgi:hypothetical protein